jgi:hypothetical protein
MISPWKKKVTREELDAVLAKINPTYPFKGPSGRVPRGVVLHNTWLPTLQMVKDYLAGTNVGGKNSKLRKYKEEQLIDNWYVSYRKQGWYSGPHFFIFPTGIWIANPLDTRGTHSPSWNGSHYGVEVIGDYSKEVLPPDMQGHVLDCLKSLYKHLGVKANKVNFKFHGEDPKTSHKDCPGKNLRSIKWIELINGVNNV